MASGSARAWCEDELTLDPILRGRLRLWQARQGYRFSVDSLLLADYVRPPLKTACDLGAGSGVVALALALGDPMAQLTAVELQARLFDLLCRNIEENQLGTRVRAVHCDLAAPERPPSLAGASFDLVVSNPPYRPLGQGHCNPDQEESIARHEVRLTLQTLVREMRRLLRPQGRAALVYPADRLPDLLGALTEVDLHPVRLRMVHPHADAPARRVLVEARKGARAALRVEPPLVLHAPDGSYSHQAARALGDLTD